MVCSPRPGPDWIPGTITEVLEPVTYMYIVDQGQRWKRRADQIESWIAPLPRADLSAESEVAGDFDTPPLPEGPDSEPFPVSETPQLVVTAESSTESRNGEPNEETGTQELQSRDTGALAQLLPPLLLPLRRTRNFLDVDTRFVFIRHLATRY